MGSCEMWGRWNRGGCVEVSSPLRLHKHFVLVLVVHDAL